MERNKVKFEIELDPDEVNDVSLENQKELVKMVMHLMLNSETREIKNLDINRPVFEGFIKDNEQNIKYYFSLKNIAEKLGEDQNENDVNNLKMLIREFEAKVIEGIKTFFIYETEEVQTHKKLQF